MTILRDLLQTLASALGYLLAGLFWAVVASVLMAGLGSFVGWFKVGYCLVAGCLS